MKNEGHGLSSSRARITALALAIVLSGFVVNGVRVSADTSPSPVPGNLAAEPVLVFNSDLSGERIKDVKILTDVSNHTLAVHLSKSIRTPILFLVKQGWVRSFIPNPGFSGQDYTLLSFAGQTWYAVRIAMGEKGPAVAIQEFSPSLKRAVFTLGSSDSILLERPMFVSIEQFPGAVVRAYSGSTRNGTFVDRVTTVDAELILNFTGTDHAGQMVRINRAWLSALGITEPRFRHGDNTPIDSSETATHFTIAPRHFSFIYAFQRDEFFRKERDYPGSEVKWDATNQRISLVNDRSDTGDELFSRRLPREVDSTMDFRLTSRWRATTQGNWQVAVPLFITSNNNINAWDANGIYFFYASRDQNLRQSPLYYLRYIDAAGVLRIDATYSGAVNTEYHFYVDFNAGSRVVTLQLRNSADSPLITRTYTVGSSANDRFGLGRIGASSRGLGISGEPVTVGWVDDIAMTYGIVPNPSVEIDNNGDNVPDGWHNVWFFASRVATDSHGGRYSLKIDDTSMANGGGMETDDIAAFPGIQYEATMWGKVTTGTFSFTLKFLGSGATILGQSQLALTSTDGIWRRLLIDGTAPIGTLNLRVIVWSTNSNTGTAYFDELFVGRGKLANSGADLDADGNGFPDSWTLSGSGTSRSSTRFHSPPYSIKLAAPQGSSAFTANVPAYPGVLHEATVYAYVESGDGVYTLKLTFLNSYDNEIGDRFMRFGLTAGMWIRMKVSQIAPLSAVVARLEVRLETGASALAYFDDASVLPAAAGLEHSNSLWAMNFPLALGQDLTNQATWALDLGMGHLRTGASWKDWEPTLGSWNYELVSKHRYIITTANAVGLDVMLGVGGGRTVLCGEKDSLWQYALYLVFPDVFFNELENLAAFLGQNLGADVHYYGIWNEPNHPCDFVSSGDDWKLFDRAEKGLRTGEAVSTVKSRYYETIANAFADWPSWASDLASWLDNAPGAIDIAGIDHYPSTWTNEGLNPIGTDWSPLDALISIINPRAKKGAIIETGFSTCEALGWFHNEIRQQTWINNALPIIRTKVSAQSSNNYNQRIVMLAWYTELDWGLPAPFCDPWANLGNGRLDGNTEFNFGILRLGNIPKIGYPDLRSQVGGFPYP